MEMLSGLLPAAPLWIVWPIIVGITVYWYLTKNFNYWKRIGIPYVPGVPIFGSMRSQFSMPLHEMEQQRYKEMGRIYGTYEGRRPVLSIADPDVLRDIFVKDFQFFTDRRVLKTGNPLSDKMIQNLRGEDWKRVRSIITPTFTTRKLKRMLSIFSDSAKTLFSNLKNSAERGEPLDMKKIFGAFTMDVIACSAFGTKIDSHNDPENPFLKSARMLFSREISWRVILFFLFPGVVRFLRIGVFPPGCLEFFKEATLKIVEERKRTGQKRNDFLQLLIDSTKENVEKDLDDCSDEKDGTEEMGHEEANYKIFKSYHSSKPMSNDELLAQCIIFFLAGYETTASTLSFIGYELAQNPDIQDRLIAEIDEVTEKKGGQSYEALAAMKYMDNVIAETLRKFPPAIRGERYSEVDYEIKGHSLTVPKDILVGIPIYAIHHDAEHYPDPEKFDPDRFTEEQKSTRHPYTYLPFGAGPRNCVGMRFALLEIKVCLSYILSRCRFSTCSQTKFPPEFFKGQGLLAPKEVILQVELRKDTKVL